jgi:hypothetical protein
MDAKLKDKKALLSLTDVYRQMAAGNAAAKIMLADCCRDNPELDSSVRGPNDTRLEKITDPPTASSARRRDRPVLLFRG